MTLNGTELDIIYERYGFSVDKKGDDLRVYVLRQGYLYGADIVPLNDSTEFASIEEDYRQGGYATKVRKYGSAGEAALSLFDGFFSTTQNSERLHAYYRDFVQRRSRSLGSPYEYIPCPYSVAHEVQPTNADIIATILGAVQTPGPQLVLIEAAAGFGKTCTAYEVLKALISHSAPQNPLFAELSKNRQARVFRYVLLDEIDRTYPGLSSTVVQHEIRQGRLPVIVDGFDELLSKGSTSTTVATEGKDRDFEGIESMLDTIGELLTDNAKIILTTRRTAIFSGDEFVRWCSGRSNDFLVTRISLNEPSIVDWLGPTRASVLAAAGMPMESLGNPVLLSFIRALRDDDFGVFGSNPDLLVERYFTMLLQREHARQDLRMDVAKQKAIFSNLARRMVDDDFTAESKDVIAELIREDNSQLIEEVRETYPSQDRPSADELAEKLAGHALLDRVGKTADFVGFVNDFVLGTLIGDNVVADSNLQWFASERMFSLAVTAFRVRNSERRAALWRYLEWESKAMDHSLQLVFDLDLRRAEGREFVGSSFAALNITGVTLGEFRPFQECIFMNCVFTRVRLAWAGLRDVGFVNCSFYECSSIGDADEGAWTRGCHEFGARVLNKIANRDDQQNEQAEAPSDAVNRTLRLFWPPGRQKANLCLPLQALYRGDDRKARESIDASIGYLSRRGLVKVKGDLAYLNNDRIGEIQAILARRD